MLLVGVAGGVVLGAAFSAIDAGLGALGEVHLRALRDEGGRMGALAGRVLERWDAVRTRLLAGRVLAVSSAAALAASYGLSQGSLLEAAGSATAVAFVYGMAAEVAATIARRRPGLTPLTLLRWMRPIELLLAPVAAPLLLVGRLTARLVPESDPSEDERHVALAVEHMIDEGEEAGAIPEDHANLLRSVLEFRDTVAREVMVPRTQMVALELSTPVPEVVDRVVESGHSRYAVYRDHVDQIEGVLYAKDLFRELHKGRPAEDITLAELVRVPAFFAPEGQKIGSVLRDMQSRRYHLAIVVDEFGGTSGIVTLEDILEEIVGDIRDEHDDDEEAPVREHAPGRWVADAGMSVFDLEEYLGEPLRADEGDFDSLGGMLVDLFGRVPQVGERVSSCGFDLVVLAADERRVTQVEIVRPVADHIAAAG